MKKLLAFAVLGCLTTAWTGCSNEAPKDDAKKSTTSQVAPQGDTEVAATLVSLSVPNMT